MSALRKQSFVDFTDVYISNLRNAIDSGFVFWSNSRMFVWKIKKSVVHFLILCIIPYRLRPLGYIVMPPFGLIQVMP